jgi:murein DD-endopeptidase MepM/ murein hydrolase activator NlpD
MKPLAVLGLLVSMAAQAQSQEPLPPLPDPDGFGLHVLEVATDPRNGVWVGTYGHGIYALRPGSTEWEAIRHDTTATSISWDFVHAIAFGPRGQIWYGTIGNGWGLSLDGGQTWRNWTFQELGPEWQYVAPSGIVTSGDTTWVATADGIQFTTNDGTSWTAIVDSTGPISLGPADTALRLLPNEYVQRISATRRGLVISALGGNVRLRRARSGAWQAERLSFAPFAPLNGALIGGMLVKGRPCGLRPAADTVPCITRRAPSAGTPRWPQTSWFIRPIAPEYNDKIDQTYRYGSTMGGNFQEHQGVEFNDPDGTPVRAIGSGVVAYAGPAEAGALTVAIRHDTTLSADRNHRHIFSTYYHNSELRVREGQRVSAGDVIALVGNTGRATNDHLHLEIHAAPTTDVRPIVDSLERFPAFTTNPELWLKPLPGTGIVAGQVLDHAGRLVAQARIYGIVKLEPPETPLSFVETYGTHAHPHPVYLENFAIGDVPEGTYVLGTEIAGRQVYREVVVEAGKLTWVVFKP